MPEEVETSQDLDSQLKEALQDRLILSELLENRGWLRLKELATTTGEGLQSQVLAPGMSIEDILQQQFTKGHAFGLLHFVEFPDMMIENANASIPQLKKLLNIEDL